MSEADFKTLKCAFNDTPRTYTYKCRTNIPVQVGHSVTVNTPKNGDTVVKVMEVIDEPPDESKFNVKEIVNWIDPANEV